MASRSACQGNRAVNLAKLPSRFRDEPTAKLPHLREPSRGLVLVIDDEQVFRLSTRQTLLSEGFDYEGAVSGAQGLALARAFRPAAILLDLSLPDRDGREVLQELKADPELKGIPVVIVTASSEEGVRDSGLALGAQEVVVKGFSPEGMRRRLTSLLEELSPLE